MEQPTDVDVRVIDDGEIERHIGNDHPKKPRWQKSSTEILESTYLHKVGIVEENTWILKLRGLCLQVSSPKDPPHVIDVLLKKPFPAKIQHAKCSCLGGKSGKCKHAVAVLRQAAVKLNFEPWTCTVGKCSWDKKELQKVVNDVLEPKPVSQFCHFMKKREPLSEIPTNTSVYTKLLAGLPDNCAYIQFMRGRGTAGKVTTENNVNVTIANEFPKSLCDLLKMEYFQCTLQELVSIGREMNFSLAKEDITNVEETTRDQSKNAKWFQYRSGRITGSTVGGVMKSRTLTSNASVLQKICKPNKRLNTPAVRYGRLHEKDGLGKYEEAFQSHKNLKIERAGLFIHRLYPWIAASPDAVASCDCCERRVVEIKCPYNCSTESTKNLKVDQLDWLPLSEQHDYYYQIQLQMLCVGVHISDFVVWAETECKIYRYQFDIDFCKKIIERSELYFYNAVIPQLLARFHTRNAPPKKPQERI